MGCANRGEVVLLTRLKTEKLILDWRKRQHTQAAVRQTIEAVLDEGLPPSFDADLFQHKCAVIDIREVLHGHQRGRITLRPVNLHRLE